KAACSGGHTFAAPEPEPRWKNVPADGAERRDECRRSVSRHEDRTQHDRKQSLHRVQKQGRDPQDQRGARNVGGADIPAAGGTDIRSAKPPHQQVPKGYGSQNITYGGADQNLAHAHLSEVSRRNRAILVYRAPWLDNWLRYKKNSRAVIVPKSGG